MNTTQRVTISLPQYLYEQLVKTVPSRKVSAFVAKLLEEKIINLSLYKEDPVKKFFSLRKNLPKVSDEDIFAGINKGRM
jgi:hypothetical protein